jgi:hypothetical protein
MVVGPINMSTISPFGIYGNPKRMLRSPTVALRPFLFSPFDINVKENMLPLSYFNTVALPPKLLISST